MHHRDPFDRMIIAQALGRSLTVVTRDAWFASYGVPILRPRLPSRQASVAFVLSGAISTSGK